jgi:diguanylate cyclase (GGDEF)-like protein/PAS domain S-box-containing protein
MDSDNRFIYFSQNMENILGVPPRKILGKTFENIVQWTGNSVDVGNASLDKYSSNAIKQDLTIMSFLHPVTGEERFIQVSDHAVKTPNNDLKWIEGIVEDITVSVKNQSELQEKTEELHKLVTIDTLTKCYSRLYFMDYFSQELERINRKPEPLSIIMYDLDNFKAVNDTYGHLVGDDILYTVSSLAKQTIRKIDILGRYGGEEFLILLPNTRLDAACEVAERTREAIANYKFNKVGHVTISVGVTSYHKGDTAKTLVDRVDSLMYDAKQAGKNTVKSSD